MANFSASNISRLLAHGTGKTAATYCLELALLELGIKDEFETAATRHGVANQYNAFELCVKPAYPDAVWHDKSVIINEHASASPDFIGANLTGDVKCPYYIDTYLEQIDRVPTKYYQQVQMQMIATGSEMGILCFYLTAPELWAQENWQEYPMALSDRFKIYEFSPDAEVQENILKAVENYAPKKQQLVELLKNATTIDFVEFFYLQMKNNKFRKVKESSNIFGLTEVTRVGDEFYYLKM